jgi:hypothetical protein
MVSRKSICVAQKTNMLPLNQKPAKDMEFLEVNTNIGKPFMPETRQLCLSFFVLMCLLRITSFRKIFLVCGLDLRI